MGFGQQSMKTTKEFGHRITFEEEEGKSMGATKEAPTGFGQRSWKVTTEFGQRITIMRSAMTQRETLYFGCFFS